MRCRPGREPSYFSFATESARGRGVGACRSSSRTTRDVRSRWRRGRTSLNRDDHAIAGDFFRHPCQAILHLRGSQAELESMAKTRPRPNTGSNPVVDWDQICRGWLHNTVPGVGPTAAVPAAIQGDVNTEAANLKGPTERIGRPLWSWMKFARPSRPDGHHDGRGLDHRVLQVPEVPLKLIVSLVRWKGDRYPRTVELVFSGGRATRKAATPGA